MVMHPQQIEDNKKRERENQLWWELDKIAVLYLNPTPASTREERMKKATAAKNMMKFLDRPTHEWCQAKYAQERT